MWGWDFLTPKLNLESHEKQHNRCEARWMNQASDQRRTSPDAGQTNPTGQRPRSYCSVRKLLLLIIIGSVYWWGKKYSYRKITMTLTQTLCLYRIALRAGLKEALSAEVGALAPVFEKLATELKHNEIFLKCKSTIQIMTFNVRKLNKTDQLLELTASVLEHNIDIACVQERRYHHCEVEVKYSGTGNGWSFISASAWRDSVNAIIGGVGMLLSPRTIKSLKGIEKIQPRMLVATLNGNPSTTVILLQSY